MIMHLGIPGWQYAFTKAGMDPQTTQWFRFLAPERLAINNENRRNLEMMNKKKNTMQPNKQTHFKVGNEKIKVEGLKRKRRRMKLKAKGNNEAVIEKFCAQSSKTATYAKSYVKKKEPGEMSKKDNHHENHSKLTGDITHTEADTKNKDGN